MDLAMQIGGGQLDVPDGPAWILVAEKFPDRGEGQARANPLTGVGVSQRVRHDAGRNPSHRTGRVQVEAQLTDHEGSARFKRGNE
jgi:hypothetical protein